MSAHGNGLRVVDKLELRDASGKSVLEVNQRPGVRPKVDVASHGRPCSASGNVASGSVIEAPMPANFEIVGNAWSTRYSITINGSTAAQVMLEPGLAPDYH